MNRIRVVAADITTLEVDAIVNAANRVATSFGSRKGARRRLLRESRIPGEGSARPSCDPPTRSASVV
jgi:hypothetical protein